MSNVRSAGWVYILASQSRPEICKIGRTSRHTPGRMLEIDRNAAYAAFGPWVEVWSRAVSDCVHVETAAHRMLAHRRVKIGRVPCKELFRVEHVEARQVVEAAACSLIKVHVPLPPKRGRSWPSRRGGFRMFQALVGLAVLALALSR